jgi:glycosyltransferase involved in cell wall biosynthesis
MIDPHNPNYFFNPGNRVDAASRTQFMRTDPEQIDVSIITPYYNTEGLFIETYNCIKFQTLQNWEWIIVDDGSTDQESVNRLHDVSSTDDRIKILRQNNSGPSVARNMAYRDATGRYLCLLDSDDLIEPTYLEKCVWFLDTNPEFSFCNSYSVIFGQKEYLWTTGFERNKSFLQANSGPPIAVIRHNAYGECGGFDESIRFGHEDWDFWMAMAKAGHWGYTIREYLQWYRKRANGRFELFTADESANKKFANRIRDKYCAIESHFPNPQRRHPQPFETLQTEWQISNTKEPNPNGKRIMFIVPWMVVGGADRVNLDLIEGLVRNGHGVTVCATLSADHRWEYKFAELTPDIFILPNFLPLTDYPRFLAYLIQSRQINTVIVTGSTIGYQLLPYLQAAAPNTAFIDLSHVEEPHWLNGGHPRFAVGYQDALDLNVVTSVNLSKWMENRGADPARIRVLYTGVRPPAFARESDFRKKVRARLGIEDDTVVIVFAGRICEQKRPKLLANILKGAMDAGLRFQALIIGDGELRPMFESLMEKYALQSCVQLIGTIPHDQWLEVLIGSDILLMPSLYEGISIALLEAMAAGVVPVVARVGGQDEIVNESTGYLISHGDVELKDYVRALVKLSDSSGELAEKSSACQTLMASQFSWANTIDNFERILQYAQKAMKNRRCQFSLSIGRELASLSLENKRLGDALDWLWNNPCAGEPTLPILTNAAPVVRLAMLFCQTRLGRILLNNSLLRNIGRAAIARLHNPC